MARTFLHSLSRPVVRRSLVTAVGTILFMIPALINGYPVMYSDASTYLASGFEWQTPFDRPITYGIFVRLTSLNGWSLWTVLVAQCALLSWMIRINLEAFLPHLNRRHWLDTAFMAIVALGTGLSWTASQLMPDVFTPILILAMAPLLFASPTRGLRVALFAVFTLSVAMHMGHLAQVGSILGVLLLLATLRASSRKWVRQRGITLLLIAVLTAAGIATMGSALAKSRHAFLMGALIENGVAEPVLNAGCDDHDWKLCAYRDQLPERAWQFLWNDDSPFQTLGTWKGTRDEFNAIIGYSLRPEFWPLHVTASLAATGRQLMRMDIGDGNGVFGPETLLHQRIGMYFPHELNGFDASWQQHGTWYSVLPFWRVAHRAVVVLGLLLLVYLSLKRRVMPPVVAFFILSLLLHAWTSATLANAIDRLGHKMAWMVVLGAWILSLLPNLRAGKDSEAKAIP